MVLILVSFLFPCWQELHVDAKTLRYVPVGYKWVFVFTPPAQASYTTYKFYTNIFVAQITVILLLTSGLVLIAKRDSNVTNDKDQVT